MPGRLTDRLRAAADRFRLRQRTADALQRNFLISNPWHAVSIIPGFVQGSCPRVAKLVGRRFLSGEAPNLPLADCPMKGQCGCRFRHHTDRRLDLRRAGDDGFPNHNYYGPERRHKIRGRRATDL